MVFYRQYRPQTLDELIGQDHVKSILKKAHQENRLSHAYLFCGPRGTGKTSTARILAKMVNCQKPEIAPCNKCDICHSITEGSNLDLIEIDAASNRGIDDIRQLRENIKLSPTNSAKKVYIIDEVHMLTNEAFNALLKTLEEPPAHVIFILATTEVQKIPSTILSRVQRLNFNHATISDLVIALDRVVKKEGLEIDPEAFQLIAKKAEGGFRDALKILDQLSSKNEKITVKLVEESVKSGTFDEIVELLNLVTLKDAKGALQALLKQLETGANIKELLTSIMDLIRMMLFIKNDLAEISVSSLGQEKTKILTEISKDLSLEKLVSYLDNFQKAYERIKSTAVPSLPLEVAVIESCRETNIMSLRGVETTKQSQIAALPAVARNDDKAQNKETLLLRNKDDISHPPIIAFTNEGGDMAVIKDKWNYILETIKPHNYSLEALLRLATVLECNSGQVLIEVPYAFHQRILETPKSKDLLESVLADVLGKQSHVKITVGKKKIILDDDNVEVAADDEIIKIAAEIFNSDTL